MDFTELYKQSGQICKFSPNGAYIAVVVLHRVVIRDADTLEIQHLFTASETLSAVVWSPDSSLIAGISQKACYVQVWKLDDYDWTAKINEGPLTGCMNAVWGPDSRHILTFSNYGLRLTVWSLLIKTSSYIQYPKYHDKGYGFRPDNQYFALLERHDGKDTVGIYTCSNWKLVKNFPVETTDAENLLWSPDGRYIAVWDHPMEYKVFIYYPDGRLLGRYSAYDCGLGIKTLKWAPTGQFLIIGSYDQKIRLLNQYTWSSSIDISHPEKLNASDITVYKEVFESDMKKDDPIMSKWAKMMLGRDWIRYDITKTPIQIQIIKPNTENPNPRIGIGLLEPSPCGRWLLSRNDNMPHCLWIFDMQSLRQSSLIVQSSIRLQVRCVRWNPVFHHQFVFLSNKFSDLESGGATRSESKSHVYLWKGEEFGGVEALEVPAENFNIDNLEWNPDGRSLILMDKDKFCVAFPLDDQYAQIQGDDDVQDQEQEEEVEEKLSEYISTKGSSSTPVSYNKRERMSFSIQRVN